MPPVRRRRWRAEATGRAGGGGSKTAPQSRSGREARGSVTGVAEGCRAEAGEAEEGAAGAGGCGADEDGAEGRDDPHTAGEGAAKAERAGANEEEKRDAVTAEGRGADVDEGFTGATRAGARSTGRGEGAAKPGAGCGDAIV